VSSELAVKPRVNGRDGCDSQPPLRGQVMVHVGCGCCKRDASGSERRTLLLHGGGMGSTRLAHAVAGRATSHDVVCFGSLLESNMMGRKRDEAAVAMVVM
jgi:hypothetical protein